MSDPDGYMGPATLTVDGRAVPVHAVLDARHEPQDGRLHWFGRLCAADPALPVDKLSGASVALDVGAGPPRPGWATPTPGAASA